MGFGKSGVLPIIPLAKDNVLLPNASLRVPVANRPDIPSLLTSVFSKKFPSRSEVSDTFIGCVPLNSPFLSKDGQQLLDNGDGEKRERFDINPGKASNIL